MRNIDDDLPVITLSAGPVDAYPVVLRALSRPVTYDFDPSFQQFYETTVRKTAESLRTALPPVILHGEPVLGLEAAAAALIGADDVVLNLASGEYGKGFGLWAARHCRELVEIVAPYDDAIDPDAVSDMLKAGRISASSPSAITTRRRERSIRCARSARFAVTTTC